MQMKIIISAVALAATIMLAGCNTPVGPLVTKIAIYEAGSRYVHDNPDALPAVIVAKEIACTVANGPNATQTNLVFELDSAGPWNKTEWNFLNLIVVSLVNSGVNGGKTNAPRPYIQAACEALSLIAQNAPPEVPTARPPVPMPPPPPPSVAKPRPQNPAWPQMQ